VSAREKHALQYADELKDRYKHHPEVKRIARHRHVPKVTNDRRLVPIGTVGSRMVSAGWICFLLLDEYRAIS
jgi:hypothetical protein